MNPVLDTYSKELEKRNEELKEQYEERWNALNVPEKVLRFDELMKNKLSKVSIEDLQQIYSAIYALKVSYKNHNEDIFFRAAERILRDLENFLKKYCGEEEIL